MSRFRITGFQSRRLTRLSLKSLIKSKIIFVWSGLPLYLTICCLFFGSKKTMALDLLETQFRRTYFEKLGDKLYASRELPKHLSLSTENYKKAILQSPGTPGIHWKIVRNYWILATKHAVDAEERRSYLKEGIKFGAIAIETDQTNSNAFLWHALINGERALQQGVMKAIYIRNELKKWLEIALDLDPNNVNAILGLAGWYFYVPEFLGGNKTVTFRLIDKAAKLKPNYTAIYLEKARFLIAGKKYKSAAIALRKLLQIKKPELPNDGKENRIKAKELLKQLEKEGKIM